MQRFVRAYTEAIATTNNRDLAMKVTSKYTGIKDPAILGVRTRFYAPKLQMRAPVSLLWRAALRSRGAALEQMESQMMGAGNV